MEDTPMDQKLASDETQEQAPLTLESLEMRLEQLAQNQNQLYEVLVKHTEERVMSLKSELASKEEMYAQAFNMINSTLAAYTAQFDEILEELVSKNSTDKEAFIKKVQERASAIMTEQMEMMKKRAEAESMVQPQGQEQRQEGSPTLTEV